MKKNFQKTFRGSSAWIGANAPKMITLKVIVVHETQD